MTGVKWVRLDGGLPYNHKILQLVGDNQHRAALLYVFALTYAGSQGTDGWIPKAAVPMLHGKPSDATTLVKAGLWEECHGGWTIHDWHDYQPTNDTITTRAAARSQAARAAANIRWHGEPNPNQ